jgi:ATP-dependent Clp protease ATP-binding subunit ClpA
MAVRPKTLAETFAPTMPIPRPLQSHYIRDKMKKLVVGQEDAVDAVSSSANVHMAGLSPEGRPISVMMFLGPTGSGKTHTVNSLAKALHDSDKNVLRIDCGEFQLEHEVARLIGAPPGYLGHRETQPLINQHKLNAVASERSAISVVLFDEIEKAAPSMKRLLLGLLDTGILKLGDNTTVNFERSMIFMTSNVGATAAERAVRPIGFAEPCTEEIRERVFMSEMRKHFAPEFINRIDKFVVYESLTKPEIERVLDIQLENLSAHFHARLGMKSVSIKVPQEAREFLLREGFSDECGAREIKRVLHRYVVVPAANIILDVDNVEIIKAVVENGTLVMKAGA